MRRELVVAAEVGSTDEGVTLRGEEDNKKEKKLEDQEIYGCVAVNHG